MEEYSVPTTNKYAGSSMNVETSVLELQKVNDKIMQIQNEYYATNSKKLVLGKNAQKREIAENVCGNVGIENMIRNTTWIIPYSNCVYFDYNMFKMFAHEKNYVTIVAEVMNLCRWCIHNYKKFSVHINLLGFSISAVERYKNVIELFCTQCLSNNENYSDYLEYIYLYNTPHFIENISRIMGGLIPPNVKEKVHKLNKQDSVDALKNLFSPNKHDLDNK
jgi:hypothetical protein